MRRKMRKEGKDLLGREQFLLHALQLNVEALRFALGLGELLIERLGLGEGGNEGTILLGQGVEGGGELGGR